MLRVVSVFLVVEAVLVVLVMPVAGLVIVAGCFVHERTR